MIDPAELAAVAAIMRRNADHATRTAKKLRDRLPRHSAKWSGKAEAYANAARAIETALTDAAPTA